MSDNLEAGGTAYILQILMEKSAAVGVSARRGCARANLLGKNLEEARHKYSQFLEKKLKNLH